MKRWVIRLLLVLSILVLVFGAFGCGKKEEKAAEQPAKQEAVEPAKEAQPTEQAGGQEKGEQPTEKEGEQKSSE